MRTWNGVDPLLHVVLHEPEIPNNTGNIGRTCVALGSALHLIHPMGFDISEKACRRAGLDYWPRLTVHEHASWIAYKQSASMTNPGDRDQPGSASRPIRRWCLTTKATCSVFDADIEPGDHLVFGKESKGLPLSIREEDPDRCVSLPMVAGERSLNLSTAVCAVMYGALHRFAGAGAVRIDTNGRLAAGRIAEHDREPNRA
jgi:tRNA (cytidine/uridine-2'-O-)-methyltransferase